MVSNEVAAVAAVAKGKGESFVSFTNRLQEKERFLGWVASVFTGSAGPAEQESVMEYAAGVLFETLKKVLPQANMWMALNSQQRGTGSGSSFNRLSAIMIEVYGKGGEEEQPEQPKHVAMVGLKGGLSRKQGTKVESEEKTEEHNKRVVTRYAPGESTGDVKAEGSEEEPEFVDSPPPMVRFVGEDKVKGPKSPAKEQGRDGRLDDPAFLAQVAYGHMQAMMDMVDEHRRANGATALLMAKSQGGSGECFEFARKGTCKFGSSCRFAHQGGGSAAPPPYLMSPERRRQIASPQKGDRDQGKGEMCVYFARSGVCRFGSACRYEHGATAHTPRETQKRGRDERKCSKAQQTGVCDVYSCDLSHGRWNKNTVEVCDKAKAKTPCAHQWLERGCRFSHEIPSQSAPRTDKSDPKNGAGLERATKRR
jgi:hypothetical protein